MVLNLCGRRLLTVFSVLWTVGLGSPNLDMQGELEQGSSLLSEGGTPVGGEPLQHPCELSEFLLGLDGVLFWL